MVYGNGTSNVHKSPLTTELTTLGHIFGIRRQNYQNQALVEQKILVDFGYHPTWFTPYSQVLRIRTFRREFKFRYMMGTNDKRI